MSDGTNGQPPAGRPGSGVPGNGGPPPGAPPGAQQIQIGPVELAVMLLNRIRKGCVCGAVKFSQEEIGEMLAGRPWNFQLGQEPDGSLIATVTPKPTGSIIVPKLQVPPGFGNGPRR